MIFRTAVFSTTLAVAALASSGAGAVAAQAAAAAPLKLLAGPGTDYASVASLGKGAIVNVMWCGTKQNWCLIDRHGVTGWVALGSLKAVGRSAAGSEAAAVFPSGPGAHGGAAGASGAGGGTTPAGGSGVSPTMTLSPVSPQFSVHNSNTGSSPVATIGSHAIAPH
ncbi:MAG TPA: SH3 domain-containing protein [Arsenicitalea sp.]|jgi:hypothetical protein|nr:SH3 domain-containing protein [Arsenicitalea sp.]